jgi:hypothetical protein
MKNNFILSLFTVFAILLFGIHDAYAGAKIKINDDSEINLGFRLQTLYINTQGDLDGDGSFESVDDFKIRRARFRLGADVTKWVSMFLQTEFAEDPGSGGDVRLIDGLLKLKPHPWAHIIMGMNMAPAMRQNLTSSGGLMALDRPGLVYKNLTWGTRSLGVFSNSTYTDSDAGLRGSVGVRDMGVTLFGSGALSDLVSLKYYIGLYDGIQNGIEDSERYTGRVQVNFFDREAGYYNLSTYLGKKKTIGVGASFDTQDNVEVDVVSGDEVPYSQYTADVFVDLPLGEGALTAEAAYVNLDLDDAVISKGTGIFDTRQSAGSGYYAQAGYFINNWQPWAEWETWNSDAEGSDLGSYDSYRVGVTYFLKGHNANIKAGYEQFNAKENFSGTSEDSVGSFVIGLYTTY